MSENDPTPFPLVEMDKRTEKALAQLMLSGLMAAVEVQSVTGQWFPVFSVHVHACSDSQVGAPEALQAQARAAAKDWRGRLWTEDVRIGGAIGMACNGVPSRPCFRPRRNAETEGLHVRIRRFTLAAHPIKEDQVEVELGSEVGPDEARQALRDLVTASLGVLAQLESPDGIQADAWEDLYACTSVAKKSLEGCGG